MSYIHACIYIGAFIRTYIVSSVQLNKKTNSKLVAGVH